MKRLSIGLTLGTLGLLLSGLLSGCTGTSEDPLEVLFVVAYGTTAAEAGIAIVEDVSAAGGTDDFIIVPNSRRPLPAPPLDYDIVDRLNQRRELVVLSRVLDTTSNLANVLFFNIEELSPDDPSTFQESRPRLVIDLDTLAIDADVSPAPSSFCPIAVEVDSEGRYIALLNDQSQCASTDPDAIDLIDLEASSGPTIIAHIQDPIITTAFFLEQDESRGGDQDRLYYFEEVAGEPELQRLDIPDNGDEPEPVSLDITIESRAGDEIVDFGGVFEDYLVLREDSFLVIPNQGGALSQPDESDAIDTGNSSQRAVFDDFRRTQTLLILSDNRLTVHQSVLDEEEDDIFLQDAIGVIDPLNEFAYLFSAGRVSRFDLFTYDGQDINSDNYRTFRLDDLTTPAFAIWVQARLEILN
jgi:hypothetical protein